MTSDILKKTIAFVTSVLLLQSFGLAAQEKSDISSSLMLLYSPFDRTGRSFS